MIINNDFKPMFVDIDYNLGMDGYLKNILEKNINNHIIVQRPRALGITQMVRNININMNMLFVTGLHTYQTNLISHYIDNMVMTKYYNHIFNKPKQILVEKYGYSFILKYKHINIVSKLVEIFIKSLSFNSIIDYEYRQRKDLPKNKSKYF